MVITGGRGWRLWHATGGFRVKALHSGQIMRVGSAYHRPEGSPSPSRQAWPLANPRLEGMQFQLVLVEMYVRGRPSES